MLEAVMLVFGFAVLIHVHRTRVAMRKLEKKVRNASQHQFEDAIIDLEEDVTRFKRQIDEDWRRQIAEIQKIVDTATSNAGIVANQVIERKVVGRIRQLTNETVHRHLRQLRGELPHQKWLREREKGGLEFKDPRDGEWKEF